MNTYILQHVPFEKPGILDELDSKVVKVYDDSSTLPVAEEIDFLVILGGPMSVSDDIEWLEKEKVLIREMIAQEKPMLGICLGAQLIAEALGAEVYANDNGKEVGFGPVTKQTDLYDFLPQTLDVLHWHGDTFTLPDKAVRLYSSDYCENQAFIYNDKVIGLQFHMETTEETLKDIVEADRGYISENVARNSEEDILSYKIPYDNRTILLKMVELITGGNINGR